MKDKIEQKDSVKSLLDKCEVCICVATGIVIL